MRLTGPDFCHTCCNWSQTIATYDYIRSAGAGLSRYESDFQELRSLGKGGYGVVVAAINRLDGRQYAVKKIKMQSQSPQGFSRLIREVTTLSRLQHPHVVRYFQVGISFSCASILKALEHTQGLSMS